MDCANNSSLGQHIRLSHPQARPEDVNDPDAINRNRFVACPGCGLLFMGNQGMSIHRRGCDADNPNAVQRHRAEFEDIELDSLRHFMCNFNFQLHWTHVTWRPLLKTITVKLLNLYLVNEDDLHTRERAICALLVLPGVIRLIQLDRKGLQRPIDFLRDADAAEHPQRFILAEALRLRGAHNRTHIRPRRSSEAGVLRRIDSLTAEGRYSAAMALAQRLHDCNGNMPAPCSIEETIERLELLNPAASDRDRLPVNGVVPDSLEFTPQDTVAGIGMVRYGSAPGADGWTFRLMGAILKGEKEDSDIIIKVTAFLNSMLKGTMPPSIRELFSVCRSVLIPKDEDSYRPIGIGECWYRLMGTLAARILSDDVGKHLLPLQTAVGLPGGAEIAAKLCQIMFNFDRGYAVACLDITNAFNTIPRGLVYRGLQRYCPHLCAWFRSFYGQASTLVDSNGTEVGTSETGVRQGDPLSFIAYCCGFQIVLEQVRIRFREHVPDNDLALTFAYADDSFLAGPTEAVESFMPEALEIFEEYGFTARLEKCKIVGRQVELNLQQRHLRAPLYKADRDGQILLGCPVGTAEYRKVQTRELLRIMSAPVQVLPRLSRQTAYALLHYCINARPNYLARVMERGPLGPFGDFDNVIDDALFDITGSLNSEFEQARVRTIRRMTQGLGGLGMLAYGDMGADLGHILCRSNLRQFITTYLPILLPQIERPPLTPLESSYGGEIAKSVKEAREIRKGHQEMEMEIFRGSLCDQEDHKSAALLTSASTRHSARWIFWRGGDTNSNVFSSQLFTEAIRSRCLLPYTNHVNTTEQPDICPCDKKVDLAQDGLHCLDCKTSAGLRTHRHNRVRDAFVAFIRSSGGYCRTEVQVGDTIPDIVIEDGAQRIYLDVVIVNPGAPSYRENAAYKACSAAAEKEQMKRTHYRNVIGVNATFIPLALETTGRLGKAAMTFARRQAGKSYDLLSKLFNEVSAAVAYYNAAMVDQMRRKIRQRRDEDPPSFSIPTTPVVA